MTIKQQKIQTLEDKLSKIRDCALFLGDMSEMHRKTISKSFKCFGYTSNVEDYKQKVDENDEDKRFLEDQLKKSRVVSTQVKTQLSQATTEYDELYKQAQHFIQNSKDKDKINQLLGLLDPTERERLQAEYKKQEEHKAKKDAKKEQALKSGNAKLYNFMQNLWEMGVSKEQFAIEIERYFTFHSLRKANVQKQLEEQLNAEIDKSQRINSQVEQMEVQQQNQNSELYQIFVEHISIMKEDMRQRRTLNQLKNIKSIKIKTEQIDIPDINSITIS